MGTHTINDLRQMQAMPLPVKIGLTQTRIRAWVNEFGVDGVYVSFSGGKDSTVLLNIVREIYPNVTAMFCDTGLEYPEIREFVKTFDNVDWVKPKMNFRQVIEKYGYPMISKEVSECAYGARKYLTSIIADNTILQTDRQTDRQHKYSYFYDKLCGIGAYRQSSESDTGGTITSIENLEALANILNRRMQNKEGGKNQKLAQMLGLLTNHHSIQANIPEGKKSAYNQERYKFFLEAPFEISNRCCNVMKKNPAHDYSKRTGKKAITATMAAESRLRTQKWLQYGCNMFDAKYPVSNPMSFWTEQDVLQYIKEHNLKIASVYGDIVYDDGEQLKGQMDLADFGLANEVRKLKTTRCQRTGCIFCGFGCHLEKNPNRFELLKESHPQIYDYIMRPKEKGGLNYKEVIDWINEHGNMNIKY